MSVASEYPDGWMVNFVLMMIEIGRFVVKVKKQKTKETKTTAFV